MGDLALEAHGRTQDRRADFDVIVPPPELARAHAQLLAALDSIGAQVEIVWRMTRECQRRPSGASCTSRQALEPLRLMNLRASYSHARDRTDRLLREHGAELAPLERGRALLGRPE